MSGSAGDVHATSTQIHTALQAMLRQMATSGIANNFDSVSHALHELGMWDWMMNEAHCTAQLHAFSTRDNKIIHQMTRDLGAQGHWDM